MTTTTAVPAGYQFEPIDTASAGDELKARMLLRVLDQVPLADAQRYARR